MEQEQGGEELGEYDVLECVAISTGKEERGLVLTKAVQPSEPILLLPPSKLFNVRTLEGIVVQELLASPERPSHPDHWRKGEDQGGRESIKLPLTCVQSLTLALAQWRARKRAGRGDEKKGVSARLDKLLTSFPIDYPTIPLMWRVEVRFWNDEKAIRAVQKGRPDLISSSTELTLMDFAWAWCGVNSRCVFVPLGLRPHQDNFTLAPLLDMANHTMDRSVECKVKWTATGGLQLSAPAKSYQPKGLLPGQEVMIAYGPHSNGTLLSEYGFTLPSSISDTGESATGWQGNPFAEVNMDALIEAELAKRGEQGRKQKLLLEDHGYWGDYTVHPHPSPAHPSHRLVIALRLLAMELKDDSALVIQPWQDMLSGKRDSISHQNETAAQDLLHGLCNQIQDGNAGNMAMLSSSPNVADMQQSKMILARLLEEEDTIAQMVKDAIRAGLTDW